MEHKIGEIFEYKGEWYQCVKGNICADCAFAKKHCSENPALEALGSCCKCYRKDAIPVIFKKLEKVGEPYEFGEKLMQRYIIYAKPIIPYNFGHTYVRGRYDETIIIEIKQNKENMEEKKIQHYDCFFDRKSPTSNLKPFNLEAAKAGKLVCTRDGRKVRIICFDAKRKDKKSIIALVPSKDYPGFEDLIAYPNNGNYYGGHENDGDLMMLPEKKERDGLMCIKKKFMTQKKKP